MSYLQNITFGFLWIIILNFFPGQFTFALQNNHSDWWLLLYNKGIELIQTNQFEEAEREFKEILEKDKKIAQAYYGLGMVEQAREPGNKRAQDYFEKALSLNKEYTQAYYGLGLVFSTMDKKFKEARYNFKMAVLRDPQLVEAWIGLGDIEQKDFQIEAALNAYFEAVKLKPGNQEIYLKFLKMTEKHDKLSTVLTMLLSLQDFFPQNPEHKLAMANIYYRLNDFDVCRATCEAIGQQFPQFSRARIELLLAKVCFQENNNEEGLNYYMSALNNIEKAEEAQAVFNDICYIMNDDEYDEYLKTPLEEMWKFFYRFWQGRDPNFATTENERIIEHYQRLFYALSEYPRYASTTKEELNMYTYQHPFSSINLMGDNLWKQSYWPKAMPEDRIIDDLGIIYIRHGKPDVEVTSVTGYSEFEDVGFPVSESGEFDYSEDKVPDATQTRRSPRPFYGERITRESLSDILPQNLSLKYRATSTRNEMIFHFQKHGEIRGWIIESIPFVLAERGPLSPDLMELEKSSYNPSITSFNRSGKTKIYAEKVKTENKKSALLALTTETSNFNFTDKQFELPFQFLSFKGPDKKTLVEVYYLVEGKNVDVTSNEQGSLLDLNQFIGFYNNKWSEISSVNQNKKIQLKVTPTQWKNVSVVDLQRFLINHGKYNFEIQIRDNLSNNLGDHRGDCVFQNYYSQEKLLMSDVIVSSEITTQNNNSIYNKNNITYFPHMFTEFKNSEMVGIYFEIYNLTLNTLNESNFRVNCTLQSQAIDGAVPGKKIGILLKNILGRAEESIATAYDYVGNSPDDIIYLNFDVGEEVVGNYELTVEVWDLNGENKATKTIPLKFVE